MRERVYWGIIDFFNHSLSVWRYYVKLSIGTEGETLTSKANACESYEAKS